MGPIKPSTCMLETPQYGYLVKELTDKKERYYPLPERYTPEDIRQRREKMRQKRKTRGKC
jgi:hypothetical protein